MILIFLKRKEKHEAKKVFLIVLTVSFSSIKLWRTWFLLSLPQAEKTSTIEKKTKAHLFTEKQSVEKPLKNTSANVALYFI